jgi:hypothetical protein
LNKKVFFSLLVVVVWLAFLGLKLNTYYRPPQESVFLTGSYYDKVGAHEQYYGIYLRDVRIGHMKRLLLKTDTGHKMFEEGLMKVSFLGEKRELRMNLYTDMDKEFLLRNLTFQLFSDKERVHIRGEMGTKEILLTVMTDGQRSSYAIPVTSRPVVPSAMVPFVVKGGFEKKRLVTVPVFDPSSVTGYEARVELVGWERIKLDEGELRAFHIKTVFKGVEVHAWIDEEGTVAKELSPIGITVQREPAGKISGYGDMTILASAETEGAIPDPRRLTFLRLFVDTSPELLSALKRLNRLEGTSLAIAKGDLSRLDLDPKRYGSPSPFITSDDPGIVAALPGIIGTAKSGEEKARSIMAWVHRSMKKTPTFSIPIASEVLKTRTGDCNEHAVLYAALARAAGIPCAIASGLVFNDGRFYYHAWNLVFTGSTWTDADSTFGQMPADATHVILAVGDISDGLEIMQFLQKVRLKVLEWR